MFDDLVVSSANPKRTNNSWTVALSAIIQACLLGILILIPLIYTEALPKTLLTTFLVPPPPPPPPPPPAAAIQRIVKPVVRLIHNGQMMAPTVVPKKVEMIKEEEMPPDVGAVGVVGGVPGGVPGGQAGGVLGGIIGGSGGGMPPPPKATPSRIRVGGNVAAAKLVRQVTPLYPPIAKTAHISGTVMLHAVIAKDGTIQELTYVSGPPLLMKNAMDAVRQWRYSPTLLNGEPVEVDTTISVVFTLGGLGKACYWSFAGLGWSGNKIRPAEICCSGRFTGTEDQIMLANLLFAGVVMFQQPTGEVGWDLVSMWHNMGIPAKSVVAILFIMSAWSIGIMIDRALMYSAARKQSRIFVQQVAGALKDNKLDEAISIAERNKKSHIAKVVATGLSEFQAASAQVGDEEVIEAANRGLERSVAIVHAEMKRGLSGLATIGSTAPFVGLFGTVMGIIYAFKGISASKAIGFSAVAVGIAEALVTTALGLVVAVPAVWTFNYFTNKVEAFDVEMDNSSMELINYFITRRGGKK